MAFVSFYKSAKWNYKIFISKVNGESLGAFRKEHNIDATLELVSAYLSHTNKKVLIIDAAVESNRRIWSSRLKEIGIITNFGPPSMHEQPSISGLTHLLQVGEGLEAWSFEKFRRIIENNGLPLIFENLSSLVHPKESEWRPQPHLDVLENISRQLPRSFQRINLFL